MTASPQAAPPLATARRAGLMSPGDKAALAAAAPARTPVNDAAYAVLASDRTVAIVGLTAARTLTLPAAAAYPQGATLTVVDESGACSAAAAVTVARASAGDAINGGAAAVLASPYAFVALQSNGANRWTVVDAATLGMAQQAPGAVAITGGSITGTAIGTYGSNSATPSNAQGTFNQLRAFSSGDGGANGGSQVKINAPGSASGQRGSIAFYTTFGNYPGDVGPRRTADFIAGFDVSGKYGGNTGGTWGSEYFAFNVGKGGNANDTEALGTEVLRLTGGSSAFGGGPSPMVLPGADNAINLGASDRRWATIYAGTGTITTSDARDKTVRGAPDPRVFDAVLAVDLVEYQWNDALDRKGPDGARLHFGATAQAVRDAFAAQGLDPARYALFCAEDLAPRGVSTLLAGEAAAVARRDAAARPAEPRYGLRYDQFDRLRTEAIRRKLQALKLL